MLWSPSLGNDTPACRTFLLLYLAGRSSTPLSYEDGVWLVWSIQTVDRSQMDSGVMPVMPVVPGQKVVLAEYTALAGNFQQADA